MRKRVALFVGSLQIGGTERNVLHLARALRRRGIEVQVWCNYSGQPLAAPLHAEGVPCQALKEVSIGHHPLVRFLRYNLPYQVKLARVLTENRDAVVLAMGFPMAYYVTIIGWLVGVRRLFFTVQDWDVWKRKRIYQWLDRLCSRLAAGIICDGEGARRLAVEHQGMLANRMVTIYDGVDPDELLPTRSTEDTKRELGLAPGRVTVGVIARLDMKKKGQDCFLEAIPAIHQRHPEVQFLLVGDGPDRAELESRAARLPQEARPIFAGSRTDLGDVLRAIDILVIPSRWESVPKILVEGMWCARAIVATRVGDIQEILPPDAGMLVPPDRPDAIAEAVCALIEDPARHRELGLRARERLLFRGLTLDRTIRKYEEVLFSGFR